MVDLNDGGNAAGVNNDLVVADTANIESGVDLSPYSSSRFW